MPFITVRIIIGLLLVLTSGYTAWADSLGIDPLAPSDFAIETVSTNFLGTIHSKLNLPIAPDSIQLYRPASEPEWNVYYDGSSQPAHSLYSMDALNTRDQYRVFLDGNHGWTKIENPAQHSDKKLLIIKDSYAHSFAPFAALHFDETHMIDLRYFNGKINQFTKQQCTQTSWFYTRYLVSSKTFMSAN